MKKFRDKGKQVGATALRIVQRYMPNVTEVVDSKTDMVIEVTEEDDKNSKLKNHAQCAMARACQRKAKADGVIISVRTAYVIKGDVATRYRVPEAVSREVVSFDRKGGFQPGVYKLNRPSQYEVLGREEYGKKPDSSTDRPSPRFSHKTENIRTSLNAI